VAKNRHSFGSYSSKHQKSKESKGSPIDGYYGKDERSKHLIKVVHDADQCPVFE